MSKSQKSSFAIIKRFLPFTRPYYKIYGVAILLLIVTTLLSLVPTLLLKFLIDDAISNGRVSLLNAVALGMALIVVFSGLTKGLMEYLHEWVSAHFIFDLRRHFFNHVQSQSMEFFSSVKLGELLGVLRVDIISVYGVLVNTLLGALSEVVQVIGITALLLYLNVELALIALVFIPGLYFIVTRSGKRLRAMSRVTRDKDVALLDFFQERISNISVVKLFHREAHEDRNHKRLADAYIEKTLERVRYKFISMFAVGTLTGLAGIAVIWYGGHKVVQGGLTVGSLVAFYLYTIRLYGPIQSLANRSIEIYNGMASADRLIEFLDVRPTVRETERPVRLETARGEIAFDRVSFKYAGNSAEVIKDFSLKIQPGQKVALVGSSGAGKTTLVNLLCRLYDVSAGRISIDGNDIRDLEFKSLYESIGVVSQDTFLFNTTIEENIRFGRPDASREAVIEAAHKAHLHEFIDQLPDGYQTVVGSRGMKLSGGQRQRLAIARVILKDAKIWVLDEFTSSLDSRSESVVYENIEPLLRGKTTLIIAHRFSTILSADQVIVLQDGAVVEAGSHAHLYQQDGVYRRLFDTQFRHGGVFVDVKEEVLPA